MKKSTAQSTEKTATPATSKTAPQVDTPAPAGFWTEVFFTEGGVSLLIIFPLTVLYFLVRAVT